MWTGLTRRYCGLSRSALDVTPSESGSNAPLVPANRIEDDRRCTSIREAVKFAKANNLLGVMFEATLLSKVPSLVDSVKQSGLLMTTFGHAIVPDADAHMTGGVLKCACDARAIELTWQTRLAISSSRRTVDPPC